MAIASHVAAVFWNEVLLNTKRVAPYVLMVLFSAHAILWWGWGPAVSLGWATNSDYYIARNLAGFSIILGLPIFNAVIMGDPVIRDFRLGVDPLIFSKPVSNANYLLGKFLGNAFVLVCCQSAFVLTLLLLQLVPKSQMIVQPFKVVPYFKHFFLLVVVSHLFLAAIYFTVGTLTRNVKIVYAVAVSFYPVYFTYSVFLKGLPNSWRTLLNPIGLNAGVGGGGFLHSAEYLNQLVIRYSSVQIANRVLVLFMTAVCLTILYFRFSITERATQREHFSVLNLSTAREIVSVDPYTFLPALDKPLETGEFRKTQDRIQLPKVTQINDGLSAGMKKLFAAISVEMNLLRSERSLVVLLPLIILLSVVDVALYPFVPEDGSYAATYATSTTSVLGLFLLGLTVFFTTESMHRDRELKIEPLLWAAPIPGPVLLISKFVTTVALSFGLIAGVGLAAIAIQLLRGQTPVEVLPFLAAYSVILIPSVLFFTCVTIALNLVLRDRYVAYTLIVGMCAGLFYLYSIGYNSWLYNPLLYRLWRYPDLTGAGPTQKVILIQRVYCLAVAGGCISLAYLLFPRKSTKAHTFLTYLRSARWPIIAAIVSIAIALITALTIRSID